MDIGLSMSNTILRFYLTLMTSSKTSFQTPALQELRLQHMGAVEQGKRMNSQPMPYVYFYFPV